MSDAWKCKRAALRIQYRTKRMKVSFPKGYYNSEYNCAGKNFFEPMLPKRRIGGWKIDCENHSCSGYDPILSRCKDKDWESGWCKMAEIDDRPYFDKCTCEISQCPFFKRRTADEWIESVRLEEVPFMTRTGKLRQEAKTAKNFFGISNEVFDALQSYMAKRIKERNEQKRSKQKRKEKK